METNYNIDYNDERFAQVEADKSAALSDLEQTYAGMIDQSDKFYNDQINATKDWANQQSQLQQENTDFAIEQIEQQKEQANKDYLKEQSGAYVDWQKQSNQYGANAEKVAAGGMTNTGFSESSQVSMYNTYQNRVATARESYSRAVLNYDNAIKDARLQNNSVLAEIAYNALQQELELSLQGFQYKNTLLLDKANKAIELDQMYYGRYQDVLQQINTENAMAEEVRQFNESMAEDIRQFGVLHGDGTPTYSGGYSSGSLGSIKNKTNSSSSGKSRISTDSSIKSQTTTSSGRATGSASIKKTMDSIDKLGLGQITAKELDNMVASGKVKEKNVNGVTTFVKAKK